MRLNEIRFEGQPPVDSYGPGFFRVQEQIHQGALILGPQGVQKWAGLSEPQILLDLQGEVDVLFIGMGAEIAALASDLRAELDNAGIGCEVMTTPSACRTYNVLLAEGRRVALAALPV